MTSIKANASKLVKLLAAALLLFAWNPGHAQEDDELAPTPSDTISEESPTSSSSQITARSYRVTVTRRSSSRKMYLLNSTDPELPVVGKIVLLKQGDQNMMALRVLKQYPNASQFAGKRVRSYGSVDLLRAGESFTALEKLGDFDPGPAPTDQDRADLSELESGADPMDNPDAPSLGEPLSEEEEEDIDAQLQGLEIHESDDFTPWYQWLNIGAGLVANNDFESGLTYFMGGGARYQLDLAHRLIFSSGTAQDAFSVEGGLYYYSIVGYAEVTEEGEGIDSYTVMPLMGNAKYTIWIDEDFGFFGYAGLTKSLVTVVDQPTSVEDEETAIELLSAPFVTFGGGALLRVGPNWYGRVDVGTDFIGGGIVLSF